MIFWWQTAEGLADKAKLKAQGVSTMLTNIMLNHGCPTVAAFVEKFSLDDMIRLRQFGKLRIVEITKLAETAGVSLRRSPPTIKPEKSPLPALPDNSLFLHCTHAFPDSVMLGVGSRKSKRIVTLSADDALKLAYRLMSLARGGETQGFEKFPS